jgi:hypothetical protein
MNMEKDGYGRATDAKEVLAAFSPQRIANAGVNGALDSHRISISYEVPSYFVADVDYFLRDVWVMLATGRLVLALPEGDGHART